MKTRTGIITVLAVALTLTFGFSAFGAETQPSHKASLYEQLLDQFVDNCEAKLGMIRSKFDHIRRDAGIAVVKGAFAKTYRKELVSSMMEDDVSPKFYKVTVYLNNLFYRRVY
jgi:hypothetical protein